MRFKTFALALTAAAIGTGTAVAQPNEIPGTDVSLGLLGGIDSLAHSGGGFPNGVNGLAMSTTSCNLGTVNVPWLQAMNANHPFIAFIVARESNGRLEQISNQAFVKHGFFALSNSQCIPCQNPSPGTFLGTGCSDTYGIGTNGDNFWLGPSQEIDPWLGTWNPVGSHFDMGQPPVPPPFNSDGNRSSISPSDAAGNRVRVRDSELNTPGTFYYQAHYMVRGEPWENRKNNLGSRFFNPSWNGFQWNLSVPSSTGGGNPLVEGTILQRWSGASLSSVQNGDDDGLVHLAAKTVDLGGGNYRYEYAVHNRDNARGIKSISIPVCPGATISNIGFHDVDDDATNTWTTTETATDLIFSTTDNPIEWNTFYNFWFEADVAPTVANGVRLEESEDGPGFSHMVTANLAPMGPQAGEVLGFAAVGSNGLTPELRACGDFSSGNTGNIVLRNALPNACVFLCAGFASNPIQIFGGTLVPFPLLTVIRLDANEHGARTIAVPGGGGPLDVFLQYICVDQGAGGLEEGFSFSNAIRVPFDV